MALPRAGQQRLDFRGEQQPLALAGVEQRQNADPIPNQQQALAVFVPQRDGELAVQVLDEIIAILLVVMDDDFGVAVRAETVPRFQQDLAQFDVIENFAVERDPNGPVLVGHGLSAAGEVDDTKASMAQSNPTMGIEVDAAVIRTAMAQGWQHAAHVRGAYLSPRRERGDAGNSTHDYAVMKAGLVATAGISNSANTSLAGTNEKSCNKRLNRVSHRCKFV